MRNAALVVTLVLTGCATLPPEAAPLVPIERALAAFGFAMIPDTVATVPVIDKLVVLSKGEPSSLCQEIVTRDNTVFRNSGDVAGASVRLAGCLQTDYVSSGSSQTDLLRLRTAGDGFLDHVEAERQRRGADVVQLGSRSCDNCGIGFMCPSAFSAYSQVCLSCIGNWSAAHELGHTLCMAHDKANAGSAAFPYGYGWRSVDNQAGDTMAYGGGRRPQYSNPAVPFLGRSDASGAETADNARVLRTRALVVAGFLASTASAPVEPEGPPYILTGLCAYTTAVKTILGGEARALDRCRINWDVMNQALGDAYPTYQHRLIQTVEIPDLSPIGTVTWQFAQSAVQTHAAINAARDQAGADVVGLLVPAMTACGVATPNFDGGSRPYMVSALLCDVQVFTFPHEVAHLAGVQHDRAHATQAAWKSYGYGFVDLALGLRDAMAYPVGTTTRVNVYASPSYLGTATEDARRAFLEEFPRMTTWRAHGTLAPDARPTGTLALTFAGPQPPTGPLTIAPTYPTGPLTLEPLQ
jgi:hypothetical protein